MRRLEFKIGNWRTLVEVGRDSSSPVGTRYQIGFSDWQTAREASKGYDAAHILDKALTAAREVKADRAAFERDTVLFYSREIDYPLMSWLLFINSREKALRILDFGGALGSLYYQHRWLLDDISGLEWGVVEQPHITAAGKQELETDKLRFFDSIDKANFSVSPNLLLLSGVIQYLPDPDAELERLLGLKTPYVFIHRTMIQRLSEEHQLAVQHVSPTIYLASYPVWLLAPTRLATIFLKHGYEILDSFDPFPFSHYNDDGVEVVYQSWFLALKVDAP